MEMSDDKVGVMHKGRLLTVAPTNQFLVPQSTDNTLDQQNNIETFFLDTIKKYNECDLANI